MLKSGAATSNSQLATGATGTANITTSSMLTEQSSVIPSNAAFRVRCVLSVACGLAWLQFSIDIKLSFAASTVPGYIVDFRG